MDALLLRALQSYVIETFGLPRWQAVCRHAQTSVETFEPLMKYDSDMVARVGREASYWLGRSADLIWEDVGTFLVTSPRWEGLRRLLRFGGTTYGDFLYSLEELPGRARMALPDFTLPEVTLRETAPDRFLLACEPTYPAVTKTMIGILTAMADDYGALCVIQAGADEVIDISVLDDRYAAARPFALTMPGV